MYRYPPVASIFVPLTLIALTMPPVRPRCRCEHLAKVASRRSEVVQFVDFFDAPALSLTEICLNFCSIEGRVYSDYEVTISDTVASQSTTDGGEALLTRLLLRVYQLSHLIETDFEFFIFLLALVEESGWVRGDY